MNKTLNRRRLQFPGAAVAVALAVLLGASSLGWAAVYERKTPVPAAFFGMVLHRAHTTTPWPESGFGSWMLWDSNLKWSDLQPSAGEWRFGAFDRQVQLGVDHGVELAYTLGQTPAWASSQPGLRFAYGAGTGAMPRDLSQYADYVAKVASRYKGRIAAYQVWNEPKLGAPGSCGGVVFFCGSADDLAQLTRVAREELTRQDPAALLLSPAFATGKGGVDMLDRYLATGAGRWLDGIGFHFYDSRPEAMLSTLAALRGVLARYGLDRLPIWDTEVGFLVQDDERRVVAEHDIGVFSRVLSPDEAGAYVARVLLLQAAAGIERVHWYAWDNQRMGLMHQGSGRPNAAGVAYGVLRRWLVGSTIRCEDISGGLWTCRLTRGGRQATVHWRTDGARLPAAAQAGHFETLDGTSLEAASGDPAPGGGAPILFTTGRQSW